MQVEHLVIWLFGYLVISALKECVRMFVFECMRVNVYVRVCMSVCEGECVCVSVCMSECEGECV